MEADTGADIIISPLSMPINATLLQRHIDAGALLVQRKSGADLPASITDGRLYHSLAKMRMTGARQFQCVLLTTGHYWPTTKGKVNIVTPSFPSGKVSRRRYPQIDYAAILSAIQGWTWRGGVYAAPLTCDDEIPGWCTNTERRLKQIINQGNGRELWPMPPEFYDPPEANDPLQELILVTDWRKILAAFDGVGPAKVNSLKNCMIEHGVEHTLIQALMWIATGTNKIPGWGPVIRKRVTDQLGGAGTWARLAELRNAAKKDKHNAVQ